MRRWRVGQTYPFSRRPAEWVIDAANLGVLAVLGFLYYRAYHDSGFNLADEGSLLVVVQRLLAGDRPYVDIDVGYGIGWYVPFLVLFESGGIDFLKARIVFLTVAYMTSALAYLTVRRWTGWRVPAFLVAVILLIVPGTLHKTFIPFLVLLNMAALPIGPSRSDRIPTLRIVFAGVAVIATVALRPDLGFCTAIVLVLSLMAHVVWRSGSFAAKGREACRLMLPLFVASLLTAGPGLAIASAGGFLDPMLAVLLQPARTAMALATSLGDDRVGPLAVEDGGPAQMLAEEGSSDRRWLARRPLNRVFEGGRLRGLAILTYLPLLSGGLMGFLLYRRWKRRSLDDEQVVRDELLGLGALTGIAYSAFPQFYIFRPDVSHLSQFMPGFIVISSVMAVLSVAGRVRGARDTAGKVVSVRGLRTCMTALVPALLLFPTLFYVWAAFGWVETGTIAALRSRTEWFSGPSGVRVRVGRRDKEILETARRVASEHSREGENLLCLPYCPGLNVATDRPSYSRRLYVDDSVPTLDPGWQSRVIEQTEVRGTPIIVIHDWAVNGTEESRFGSWAGQFMAYVTERYDLVESVRGFDFYVRRRSDSTPGG